MSGNDEIAIIFIMAILISVIRKKIGEVFQEKTV